MDSLLIRPMVEPDLLAYKALRDGMLAAHPEAFTSDAETEIQRDLASYRSRLTGGANGTTLFTLVALDGGRLVGALTCEREPRRKVQHTAHLVGMMVAASHRGRGLGRALLAEALDRLQATPGLAQVTLSVTAGNRAAIGLYESQGFERYGRLPDAIRLPDGRRLDKDLMVRRLGPAPRA
ncbi:MULTISPECIES: GNAT family N-acetyltransferase [Roseateles]|uniref:GNAT family N-acetyltransferase n=1 Tax=Pelomonas caseinilytica TaxID=2906763 RepID=A0ABS8XI18_9BURK|nr:MULTISPECIES: GNAT family N-acetyltransferase [unclassified Roseateles]MCE4536865.1 GNAT family N-acetyltransferase [Pelomonas sp. P7]HEV6967509.1 GNAT family N-acetyltransferase [Roseateles sp.]